MIHTAYEEDFVPWVETQAALLRDRKFDLLDIPNLYEELTSMASHIRHQLASRLWGAGGPFAQMSLPAATQIAQLASGNS